MDPIYELIMQDSTTLDGPVIVRLVILMMVMEFVSLIIGYLSQLRK